MKCAPCKGCSNRRLGCHSTCTNYILWKKEWDVISGKNREYNSLPFGSPNGFFKKKGLSQ